MAPTILILGGTGNTGPSVVETLSGLLEKDSALKGHRIIALTRSANGAVAQKFAKLPGVEVIEKNWTEVTAEWLREHEVVKAFIASVPRVSQFIDESTFLVAALQAAVKYVVRISTFAPNVRPDAYPFYARAHWAIEALLSSPEFERLQWTSLQPNGFSTLTLQGPAEFIKEYRRTGKQGTLRLFMAADAPVGIIDPYEIGVLAARLLALQDPTPHNKGRYIISGPEDATGNSIVELVEKNIGTKVENVIFKDLSFVDAFAESSPDPTHIVLTIKKAAERQWLGEGRASSTSKEVLELAAPKNTPADVLKRLLEG
ncbi:hypothetical protein F5Y03DRAFT_369576 [Xylaria venustula]|nr:hypothetical protein F5Y03DRAFT_369576 [Xylaria venustula]